METALKTSGRRVRFDPFELDLSTRELHTNGQRLKLRGHPIDVLAVLLEHPGELVTREELQKRLWPQGTFVDFEQILNNSIRMLRDALGDKADAPRFIETLPRLGYRFIAPVETPPPKLAPETRARPRKWTHKLAAVAAPLMTHWISAAASGAALALVVMLYALNVAGLRGRLSANPAPPRIDSIAVLPLANLSGDPEQQYFADGITEELITDLGHIGALRVISRTSVMRYKGTKKTLPEIARDLNVDAIVEGTVQRFGNKVRITANLFHAPTDRHLWGAAYERDLRNVLALQDEVAGDVAYHIQSKLTPPRQQRLAGSRPVNPEAYPLYLEGRYFANKRTLPALEKSIQLYRQALEKDSNSARTYVGLSESYANLSYYGGALPKAAFPKARAAALKALEVDSTLAEAHAALGDVLLHYDWDWSGASRELKSAIELNPNSADAHDNYAVYLRVLGRQEQAIAENKRAQELDPVSPRRRTYRCVAFNHARRFNEAIEQCRKALELDPNFGFAREQLGFAYRSKGMFEQAMAEYQKADRLIGGSHMTLGLARLKVAMGRRDEVVKMLDRFAEQCRRGESSPVVLAKVYEDLGKKQKALDWLEVAYEQRDPLLLHLRDNTAFESLHSDPRFQDLVRRMNFPPL